jgi:hypothetical protein
MKKIILAIILVALSALLAAQNNNEQNIGGVKYEKFDGSNVLVAFQKNPYGYYFADFEHNKLSKNYALIEPISNFIEPLVYRVFDSELQKYLLMNANGELLTTDLYDYVGGLERYIEVKKDNLYGLISPLSGDVALTVEYNSLDVVCCNNKDYLTQKNNDEWAFLDVEKNKTYFTVKAQRVEDLYIMYAETRLFLYMDESNKYNLLNVNGNKLLKEDYDDISICYVYYQYYEVVKNNKHGMVDNRGNILIPVEYDSIEFLNAPQHPKMLLKKGTKTHKVDLNKIKEKYFDKKQALTL